MPGGCKLTFPGLLSTRSSSSPFDVFRPRGLRGKIVVSECFKDRVERHGFTKRVLTPTEEYAWDPSNLGPAPRESLRWLHVRLCFNPILGYSADRLWTLVSPWGVG